MQFERVNAITGDVASRAEAMTVDQASAIAETAARGHADWAAMGPNARRAVLMKAADALEARKDDFVAAMMNEVGATAGWAMFNLMLAAGMVCYVLLAACPWRCASRLGSFWVSPRGTLPSFSVCVRLRCRWPVGIR